MKKTGTNLKPPIEINIENKIPLIRGKKVMLDRDLAALYGITTGNLNKAVSRNIERFPEDFMFQLSKDEYDSLGSQFGNLKKGRNLKNLPQAFTQEGVAMFPDVLKSKRAIEANVQIIGTFNRLREILLTNKDKYFREAFGIACSKGGNLNSFDEKLFLNVMQLLGADVVDQIENLSASNTSNKGILLVGGDYDLLSGVVGYIWYSIFLNGPLEFEERSPLIHKDFTGYNEEEIKTSLFSQPDGLMNMYKHERVLFLRDINVKHADVLKRIVRAIRGARPYIKGEEFSFDYKASIIAMNIKQTEGLSPDITDHFQEIRLGDSHVEDKAVEKESKQQTNSKDIIATDVPSGTKWSIDKKDKKSERVLYDKKYPIELTPLEFAIFSCLHKHIGNFVKVSILEECWENNKPKYENFVSDSISKLRSKLKYSLNKHGVSLDNDIIVGNERPPKIVTSYKLLP